MKIDFNTPVGAAVADDVGTDRPRQRSEVPAEDVFPQSVASGDPSPGGAILWTRIAPEAHDEDVPLIVEIARDERFENDLQRRVVDPDVLAPEHDYTVKIDLDESALDLEADTSYYYRFEYDGVTSQMGRCRTLPDEDASPEAVRFALVTCQDYQNGYFQAHRYVAQEAVDYLVDLGDHIYEVSNGAYTRDRRPDSYPEHDVGTLPSEEGRKTGIAHDLSDYRHLYRTYRSDRALQAALERHTRIFCWDDHEFANNVYWDRRRESPRAPEHPYDGDPDRMSRLVRDALQAWYEYTPTRVEYDPAAEEIRDVITLYRTFRFGDLVTLIMTDERLHRDQPRRQSTLVKNRLKRWLKGRLLGLTPTPSSGEPEQTMLGATQRQWFIDEIHDSESEWTAWGNEVLTLPIAVPLPTLFRDAWDGFEEERRLIMREVNASQMLVSLEKADRGVRNFITLTGDMHSCLAGYQRTTYPRNTVVGVELMTPAVTSINIAESFVKWIGHAGDRFGDVAQALAPKLMETLVSPLVSRAIPDVRFFDSQAWGYSVVTFTPDHCTYRAYDVDKTRNSADAERTLVTEIRIPSDRVEIQNVA